MTRRYVIDRFVGLRYTVRLSKGSIVFAPSLMTSLPELVTSFWNKYSNYTKSTGSSWKYKWTLPKLGQITTNLTYEGITGKISSNLIACWNHVTWCHLNSEAKWGQRWPQMTPEAKWRHMVRVFHSTTWFGTPTSWFHSGEMLCSDWLDHF